RSMWDIQRSISKSKVRCETSNVPSSCKNIFPPNSLISPGYVLLHTFHSIFHGPRRDSPGVYLVGARTSPNLKGKEEASMSKVKMIKPIDGFTGVSDTDVLARGTNVLTKLAGNANFPTLPIDLATLKAALDAFSAAISEALDGGKKAIAEKRKQRVVV